MRRRSGRLLAIAGLLFVAGMTLTPLPRQAAAAKATALWCLVCGDYGGVDVVVNVLLFIPLGLGLRLMGWPSAAVVAAGAAVSFSVELLQLTVVPGRDASLSDLLTNSLGSALGSALGSRLASLLRPDRRQARFLATAAGLLWLASQAGTGLLLQPWAPPERTVAMSARTRPGHEPFAGKVTSAVASARLDQEPIQVDVTLVSGSRVFDWTPVFELMGSHGPVLAVDATGADLAFRPSARAYLLRLRGPGLRLFNALPSSPGGAVRFKAEERGRVLRASVAGGGPVPSASQPLSPSFGWSLLLPFDYAFGPETHWLTGLWIAGLLLPIGYWSAATGEGHRRRLLALGSLLLAGLGLVPLLLGYPRVHWSEWVGGVAGLATGWATYRAAAYFGGRCDSPSIRESC